PSSRVLGVMPQGGLAVVAGLGHRREERWSEPLRATEGLRYVWETFGHAPRRGQETRAERVIAPSSGSDSHDSTRTTSHRRADFLTASMRAIGPQASSTLTGLAAPTRR